MTALQVRSLPECQVVPTHAHTYLEVAWHSYVLHTLTPSQVKIPGLIRKPIVECWKYTMKIQVKLYSPWVHSFLSRVTLVQFLLFVVDSNNCLRCLSPFSTSISNCVEIEFGRKTLKYNNSTYRLLNAVLEPAQHKTQLQLCFRVFSSTFRFS